MGQSACIRDTSILAAAKTKKQTIADAPTRFKRVDTPSAEGLIDVERTVLLPQPAL